MPFETDMFTGCDGLFICIAKWANTVTNGYFWLLIIIGMGIVLFTATIKFGLNRAFGFATFAMGMLSILMIFLGLMTFQTAAWFIVLMVLGIIAMRLIE